MTTKTRLRTVFDLTPQELHELRQINLAVMATVPPARPRRGSGFNNYSDYAFDYGIYERYKNNHALAKQNRSDWIRSHRVNRQVVLQAIRTDYNPYAHADRLGLVAPPHARSLCPSICGTEPTSDTATACTRCSGVRSGPHGHRLLSG